VRKAASFPKADADLREDVKVCLNGEPGRDADHELIQWGDLLSVKAAEPDYADFASSLRITNASRPYYWPSKRHDLQRVAPRPIRLARKGRLRVHHQRL
jgi:hypothetical protein